MSRATKLTLTLVATTLLAMLLYTPIERRLTAARLLARLRADASLQRDAAPGQLGTRSEPLPLPSGGTLKGRFYGPLAAEARITIILGHGIHSLGIDEPRLVKFSQQLASLGCRVFTPELEDLRNLELSDRSIEVFRASVAYLKRPDQRLGLAGFSFAGGLALRAAESPETAKALEFVASVGGHQDLSRTLHFIAEGEAKGPQGTRQLAPNQYGLVVVLNEYLPALQLEEQAQIRALLKLWIAGKKAEAEELAEELETQKAYDLFQLVRDEQRAPLSAKLLPLIQADSERLASLSPRARLRTIRTKMILIHGSGDDVIPPEETQFAIEELSSSESDWSALVTPLVDHVGPSNPGSIGEKLSLVNIMSQLL